MTDTSYDDLRDHLARECGLLVRLLRRQSARDWSRACPPFPDRLAAATHVAQVLAEAGLDAEGAGTGRRPRHALPVLPAHALPDVVTVLADDLDAALAAVDPAAATDSGTAVQVAAAALAEILLHRRDLDGSAPGPRTSAAALEVLGPSYDGPSARALLALAAARCAVPRNAEGAR